MSTLAEAAAACGIKKSTIPRAIKSGKVSATKGEPNGASNRSNVTSSIHPIMCCGNATSASNSGTGAQLEIQM